MRYVFKLAIALCVVAASPVAMSQNQALRIHGTVIDSNTRRPIIGAKVTASGDAASASDTTDDRGVFALPLQSKVKPGDVIRLYVSKAGYQPWNQREAASSDATIIIELIPQKNAGKTSSSATTRAPGGPIQSAGIDVTAKVLRTPGSGSGNSLQVTFETDGTKDQELRLGVRPLRLAFRPPGIIVEDDDLPKRLVIRNRKITIIRFTDTGFVIDSHGARGIGLQVSVVDAKGAQNPSTAPPETPKVQIKRS